MMPDQILPGRSMSDIIIKAQRSSEITRTRSLSAWKRVWLALEALSGLTLSTLNSSAKEAVEAQLAAVNQITAAYDIEVEADYEKLVGHKQRPVSVAVIQLAGTIRVRSRRTSWRLGEVLG